MSYETPFTVTAPAAMQVTDMGALVRQVAGSSKRATCSPP